MAKCENCRKDKKHRNSTYFQMLNLEGKRKLPPESYHRSHSWKLLDAFYYCHDCIRNHWFVRKEISRKLRRKDVQWKVIREIPEMRDTSRDDRTLPA